MKLNYHIIIIWHTRCKIKTIIRLNGDHKMISNNNGEPQLNSTMANNIIISRLNPISNLESPGVSNLESPGVGSPWYSSLSRSGEKTVVEQKGHRPNPGLFPNGQGHLFKGIISLDFQ